jgi:sugar phosphate isomerase/epimerase
VRLVGKKHLKALHVHDNGGERDSHWLPGTGVIDWSDFSASLKEIGFEGAVSIETGVTRFVTDGSDTDQRERGLAAFARRIAENKMN